MASAAYDAVIDGEIFLRHPSQTEALLKTLSASRSVNLTNFLYSASSAIHIANKIAGDSVLDDFRHRAERTSDHRGSTRQRLDHHDAKWFRPVDGEQQCDGIAQKCTFFRVTNLPDKVDQRVIQQRFNDGFKMLLVDAVDLGRDLQRHAHAFCYLNGLF